MNRIDWKDNPGTCIRRDEVFECSDSDLIKSWVDAGYVEIVLVKKTKTPDAEEKPTEDLVHVDDVMVKKTKTPNIEEKPTENTTPKKSTAKKV